MAGGRIKGITVEIGGDTTKLQTALAEILCDHLGIEFSGVENLKEEDFAQLKAIRVYNDARIEIE